MNETILQRLSALAVGDLPREVTSTMPARVLDIIGIAVRATTLDTSAAVTEFALDQGSAGQATAIGADVPVSATDAAFVNGVLAHSLDYDDTHLPSILHPSASVVPAALAVGEWSDARGPDLLAAVAVGLEIAVRLGMGGYDDRARQSVYFERGQHATSICGAVGSAAAASRLLGADADGVGHAMAIACSMASGIIEANREGGTVKRLHCGWAARAGVTAAQLARRGITGPATAIEGRFGLFTAFLGDYANHAATIADLGDRWNATDIFYKPYPANHFTHTGIDAAMAVRERGIGPDDVARMTLRVAPPTVRTIGDPIDVKRAPETGYQAQFSGPYTVVAGLLGGEGLGVGLGDFTDALAQDPLRRSLMERVSVVGDDSLLDIYPYQFPARLEVETADGATVVEEVLTNRGGNDRPLSSAELATKFGDNVDGLVEPAAADEIISAVESLKATTTAANVMAPIANNEAPRP